MLNNTYLKLQKRKDRLLKEISDKTLAATDRFRVSDIFVGIFMVSFGIGVSFLVGLIFPILFFILAPIMLLLFVAAPDARRKYATKELEKLNIQLQSIEKSMEGLTLSSNAQP